MAADIVPGITPTSIDSAFSDNITGITDAAELYQNFLDKMKEAREQKAKAEATNAVMNGEDLTKLSAGARAALPEVMKGLAETDRATQAAELSRVRALAEPERLDIARRGANREDNKYQDQRRAAEEKRATELLSLEMERRFAGLDPSQHEQVYNYVLANGTPEQIKALQASPTGQMIQKGREAFTTQQNETLGGYAADTSFLTGASGPQGAGAGGASTVRAPLVSEVDPERLKQALNSGDMVIGRNENGQATLMRKDPKYTANIPKSKDDALATIMGNEKLRSALGFNPKVREQWMFWGKSEPSAFNRQLSDDDQEIVNRFYKAAQYFQTPEILIDNLNQAIQTQKEKYKKSELDKQDLLDILDTIQYNGNNVIHDLPIEDRPMLQ